MEEAVEVTVGREFHHEGVWLHAVCFDVDHVRVAKVVHHPHLPHVTHSTARARRAAAAAAATRTGNGHEKTHLLAEFFEHFEHLIVCIGVG